MKFYFFVPLLMISNLIKLYQGLTNTQANMNEVVTVLLLGQTRSGKSCFVNSLFNKKIAKVGSEDGEPTTTATSLYRDDFGEGKINLNLIDTKGLDNTVEDLENLYSLSVFFNKTQTTANEIKLDYIFFFLSLNSEFKSLKSDIEKIQFIFGKVKRIEIILTKGDKPNESTKKYLEEIYNIYQGEIAFTNITINSVCEGTMSENIKKNIFERIKPNKELKNIYEASELTERLNKLDNFIKYVNTTLNSSLIENLHYIYKDFRSLEEVDNDVYIYKYLFFKLISLLGGLMISIVIGKKYFPNFKDIIITFINKFQNSKKDNKENDKVNDMIDDNLFYKNANEKSKDD